VEFLEEGGVTPLGGGKKRVKMLNFNEDLYLGQVVPMGF
jgi:hypothetical protein